MKENLKGGGFLTSETKANEIFILEEFNEEARMMLDATKEFNEKEIKPNIFEFEKKNYALTEKLMKKIGEMGLLGITVPEKYGGLGMGLNVSMLICGEISSYSGSIATAYGAHTGIGTLPILFYGSEDVKEKFLPKICSGEWMSCYNLTEPNAGSDANSGKTIAVYNEENECYEITGQKIWISNAGFAEVFIVFGKIDDDENITGFVLEKSKSNGITLGEEESKLGLHASSTRQVFYDKTVVPKNQMLGIRGNGFKIALNALNVGRIKLGAATGTAAIKVLNESIKYAIERKQFGKSISDFGAIQEKLATMATSIYTTFSGLYRAGYNIEQNTKRLESLGIEECEAKKDGVLEYSIECSIIKVHGSEVIRDVSDEAIQIFGGMGFSAESIVEPAYRDARISRIYEGTNEINRMLAFGELIKRGFQTKELNLKSAGKKIPTALIKRYFKIGKLTAENVIQNYKYLFLLLSKYAADSFGLDLEHEQEIIMNLSDIMGETYVAESVFLRVEKIKLQKGNSIDLEHKENLKRLQLYEANLKIVHCANTIVDSLPDTKNKLLRLYIRLLTPQPILNPTKIRRSLAKYIIEKKDYPW